MAGTKKAAKPSKPRVCICPVCRKRKLPKGVQVKPVKVSSTLTPSEEQAEVVSDDFMIK